jgi:hypothetical protein
MFGFNGLTALQHLREYPSAGGCETLVRNYKSGNKMDGLI